jgi:hypothetical protein
MNKKIKKRLPFIGIIVLVALLIVVALVNNNRPSKYDGFAKCIKNSGAKLFGTFWCSACNTQKEMFGRSERLLPYVECSTANGNSQTVVCQQSNIESYPTWEFPDGNRQKGVLSFEVLAEKTGCSY